MDFPMDFIFRGYSFIQFPILRSLRGYTERQRKFMQSTHLTFSPGYPWVAGVLRELRVPEA